MHRVVSSAAALIAVAVVGALIGAPSPATATPSPDLPPWSSPAAETDLGTRAADPRVRILSPDGTKMYAILGSDVVTVIDTASRRVDAEITIPHYPNSLALSPDGGTLYVGNDEGPWASDPAGSAPPSISIIDTADNTVRTTVRLPGRPWSVTVSADGRRLAFPIDQDEGPGTTARTYLATLDLTTMAPYTKVPVPDGDSAYDIAFSRDLSQAFILARAGTSDRVDRVDMATGAVTGSAPLGGDAVSMIITPDAMTMAVTERKGQTGASAIEVVDLSSMSVSAKLPLDKEPDRVVISDDGQRVVAFSWWSSTIHLGDVRRGETTPVALPAPVTSIMGVLFLPGDQAIAVAVARKPSPVTSADTATILIDASDGTVTARIPGAGHGLLATDDGRALYSTRGTAESNVLVVIDLHTVHWHPEVDRLAGADRYAMAVEVSRAGHPDGADIAFVASGADFPDALSVSSAAAGRGPLLLTGRDEVPPSVIAELRRLDPSRIVVVGGRNSVGPSAITSLSKVGADVTVVDGADRYATARAIVGMFWPDGAEHVFIASGQTFPDALSASGAAHSVGAPLLVVNGTASTLDAATKKFLDSLGATSFTIVGGSSSVGAGVAADLARRGDMERLAGPDRFSTSTVVNAAAFQSPPAVFIASGTRFADALAGGVLAGSSGAPLYVVPTSCIPALMADHFAAIPSASVTLIGGEASLDARAAALGVC